jgi:molybdate transport system regulatory protein
LGDGLLIDELTSPLAPRVKLKLWFQDSNGKAFFGEGLVRLLEAIDKYRSVSLACRETHMSYRYALHRISIAEKRLGLRFVDRFRGGGAKGGAELTEQGRYFLQKYLDAKRCLEELAQSF